MSLPKDGPASGRRPTPPGHAPMAARRETGQKTTTIRRRDERGGVRSDPREARTPRAAPASGRASVDIRDLLLRRAPEAAAATSGHRVGLVETSGADADDAGERRAQALDRLLAWLSVAGASSPCGASRASLSVFAASELHMPPADLEAAVSQLHDDGAVYETIEGHLKVLEGYDYYSRHAAVNAGRAVVLQESVSPETKNGICRTGAAAPVQSGPGPLSTGLGERTALQQPPPLADTPELRWFRQVRRCARPPRDDQRRQRGTGVRLNEKQKAAAACDPTCPLIILAGAGTGKTTTLLGRVEHLIRRGAQPKHILLLSFTNSSVDDIAERLAGALGSSTARQMICTTIHSFCLALLRCFGPDHLGLGSNGSVQVAEPATARRLLHEAWEWSSLERARATCAHWLGMDASTHPTWEQVFSRFANEDPQAFADALSTPLTPGSGSAGAASGRRSPMECSERSGIVTLSALAKAMGLGGALRPGTFQYGHFIFSKGAERDMPNDHHWAAWKAVSITSVAVPKDAVLEEVELTPPLAGHLLVGAPAADLPAAIRAILADSPLAQARVRFRVPVAPPPGSPAALWAREEGPTWRHHLAQAIYRCLLKKHRPHEDSEPGGDAGGAPAAQTVVFPELQPPKGALTGIRRRIAMAKRNGNQPADYSRTGAPGCMGFCYAYYQDALRRAGLVDFDDMLGMAAELLRVPCVRSVVVGQQRHILVDEFQDVGERQFAVLKPLIGARSGDTSFSAVGDDDQTIYTWNGSTTKIFEMLKEHCCGRARTVQLVDNYRSSHLILQVGHAVLRRNTKRIPKVLRSRAAWAEDEALCSPPLLWECGTPNLEAIAIADEIQAVLAERSIQQHSQGAPRTSPCGTQPSDVAVLFRCFNFRGKAHSPLVSELTRRGIHHFVVREEPFWQRGLALDLLAYLQLAVESTGDNPGADDAFLRALARPCRGCGKGIVARLRERQRRAAAPGNGTPKPSLEAVARDFVQSDVARVAKSHPAFGPRLPARAAAGLCAFLDQLVRLREQCALLRVDDAMDAVVSMTGYTAWGVPEGSSQRGNGCRGPCEGDVADHKGGDGIDVQVGAKVSVTCAAAGDYRRAVLCEDYVNVGTILHAVVDVVVAAGVAGVAAVVSVVVGVGVVVVTVVFVVMRTRKTTRTVQGLGCTGMPGSGNDYRGETPRRRVSTSNAHSAASQPPGNLQMSSTPARRRWTTIVLARSTHRGTIFWPRPSVPRPPSRSDGPIPSKTQSRGVRREWQAFGGCFTYAGRACWAGRLRQQTFGDSSSIISRPS